MIIEEIRLRNIRSHANTVVTLKEGINLIHGDIGAGKSSILYATEFALFGTGSRFGKNDVKLLRAGERKGEVEVRIDVDGAKYVFHREIKNGLDRGGWVMEGGVKNLLSATELRKRALEILNLREPRSSRSRSYIYEYAIFTPQEEMKKILEDSPEDRMKILRKAFGLTDYASARDNAKAIAAAFDRESRILGGQIEGMEEKGAELSEVRERLEELEREKERASVELEMKRRKEEELRSRILEYKGKEAELQDVRLKLQNVRSDLKHLRSDMERIEGELQRIENLRKRLETLKGDYERYMELERMIREEYGRKAERDGLESRLRDLEKRISEIDKEVEGHRKELSGEDEVEERIARLREGSDLSEIEARWRENARGLMANEKELEHLRERLKELEEEERGYRELSGQKVCPKCGQELTEDHVRTMISGIEREKEGLVRRIRELERKVSERAEERKRIEEERSRAESMREELQHAIEEKNRLDVLRDSVSRRDRERMSLVEERASTLERISSLVVADIERMERDRDALRERYDEYVRAKGEVDKERELEEELASQREEVGRIAAEERELEEKAKMLEPVSEELRSLGEERESVVKELSALTERVKNLGENSERQREEARRLESELRRLERKAGRKRRLDEAKEWLSDFSEKMGIIEKNMVNFLNQEFQVTFQELFSTLIEGGEITVEMDESFTPVIKENGMDINLNSLSGGERTSVAMAYRLALNRTVQRESVGREESTIILDEPTDGFSSEQIEQFGELLRVIGCRQVILVSHEQELMSCADNVIRVKKENGISKII